MAATIHDLQIDVGETLRLDVFFGDVDENGVETPENMTGSTASASIRAEPRETATLIKNMEFVSSGADLVAGAIRLYVDESDTSTWEPGTYYYSAKIVQPDGDTVVHVKGRVLVNPRITA